MDIILIKRKQFANECCGMICTKKFNPWKKARFLRERERKREREREREKIFKQMTNPKLYKEDLITLAINFLS
jgi:hypothetical protein